MAGGLGGKLMVLALVSLLEICLSCPPPTPTASPEVTDTESKCKYDETKEHTLYYFGLDKFEALTGKTLDECKVACEETTAFDCLSINYNTRESSCILSALSTEVKPWPELTIKPWPGTDYYEKKECASKCIFHEFEGYALYGYNDVILKKKSAVECKEICLERTDLPCRSFDYTVKSGTCYLSSESRETQNGEFGRHGDTVYFEPHCDGTKQILQYARECTITKEANTALKSGREWFIEGNVEDCQRFIRMTTPNPRYTLRSFDYSHATNRCYISTEDKDTFSEYYGPEEGYDYYGMACESGLPPTTPQPELPCTYEKQTDHRIFFGVLYSFYMGGMAPCVKYCQSEHFPTCQSIEYERATGICTLMSRSTANNEIYSWPGYDYYEKQCPQDEEEEEEEYQVEGEGDGSLDQLNCQFDVQFGEYLPSDNDPHIADLQSCFYGCENDPENCKSINFFSKSDTCQHNPDTIATSSSGLQENRSSLFVEKKCAAVIDATGCQSNMVAFGSKCYNLQTYWQTSDKKDNTKERCDRQHGKPAFIQSKQELKFLAKYLKIDIEFEEMWTKTPVNITAWWIGGISKMALQGSLLSGKPNNVDTFPALAYTGEDEFGISAYSKDVNLQIICEQERKKVICPKFMFQCKNYGCVSSSWVCDGQADCSDESDEHACPDEKRALWRQ